VRPRGGAGRRRSHRCGGRAASLVDGRRQAFGSGVIELALALRRRPRGLSLHRDRTADEGVPAKMTFVDDTGISRTDAVTLHLKGQRGSGRPLDDKPASR